LQRRAAAIAALNETCGPKPESGWRRDRPLASPTNAPGASESLRTFRAAKRVTLLVLAVLKDGGR
jgi:hypothetical protein